MIIMWWWSSFALVSWAQIRVLAPAYLQKEFSSGALAAPNGVIPASTATFGSPTYGESFVGRVLLMNDTADGGCNLDLGDPGSPAKDVSDARLSAGARMSAIKDVFLIPRGSCSFTVKVLNAQKSGAHAVILVDRVDSPWDRVQIGQVILSDDMNLASFIKIPSLLVTAKDGQALMDAAAVESPIVSIEWDLPLSEDIVTVDFWGSPGSTAAQKFIKTYVPLALMMAEDVNFRTHTFITRLGNEDGSPLNDSVLVSNNCVDKQGAFCVEVADSRSGFNIDDTSTLREASRQMCLRKYTAKPSDDDFIDYSRPWWIYMNATLNECIIVNEKTKIPQFHEDCAWANLEKVYPDTQIIRNCIDNIDEMNDLFLKAKNNNGWSNLAMRINGARFSGGITDLSLVVRAICSAFENEPNSCVLARQESERMSGKGPEWPNSPHLTAVHKDAHMTFLWNSFGLLLLLVCLLCVGLYTYQNYSAQQLRQTLRSEVSLEVKSQLQDYYRVDDPPQQLLPSTSAASTSWNGGGFREQELQTHLKFR